MADTEKTGDTYEELADETGKRGGLFGRMNQKFQDALQDSRGTSRRPDVRQEGAGNPYVTADDIALRRARNTTPQRMIIPDGVIIDGSLTSGSETEIAGRIDGDVTVDGVLTLGPTALISGNVRTRRCQVDGMVDGRMECSEELSLGENGRLNADCVAGKRISVAGQIFGNIQCSGILHILATAQVDGNIKARRLIIEEGAVVNGSCTMRAPSERQGEKSGEKPSEKKKDA